MNKSHWVKNAFMLLLASTILTGCAKSAAPVADEPADELFEAEEVVAEPLAEGEAKADHHCGSDEHCGGNMHGDEADHKCGGDHSCGADMKD